MLFAVQIISSQVNQLGSGTVSPQVVPVDPPPGDYNAIKFTYDQAGNQTKRQMIYLTANKNNTQISDSISTSVIENEKLMTNEEYADVKYYPNPVRSELFLKWNERGEQDMENIQVYDINGKLVMSFPHQNEASQVTISFEHLPQGYYNLFLVYTNGEKKDFKIVKQ